MVWLILSAVLLVAGFPAIGTAGAVWLLAGSQLALLLGQLKTRRLSGVGGFVFFSFLFFGIRPIYVLTENDYALFTKLFQLRADLSTITSAMWWASAALWCFAAGATCAASFNRAYLRRRRALNAHKIIVYNVPRQAVAILLMLQLITLPFMWALANVEGLYRSGFGAYLYDLPVLLQSVHIFAALVLVDKCLRRRSSPDFIIATLSIGLLLTFSWLMRDVSNFRSFYLTGLLIAGLAMLQMTKPRVGLLWLIVPFILFQPLFAYLGSSRFLANEELLNNDTLEEVLPEQTLPESYWHFYRHNGDMNIFDTFVAAKETKPSFRPYLWSWIYVPFHLIPRAVWENKPKAGITMDMSFTRGAPYSPGIAGFFLRDGGLAWMLANMLILGYIIAFADWWVATMSRSYLQCCLIAILAVNGMYLSRFFLWQYFYQILYATIPCVALAWYLRRHARRTGAMLSVRHSGYSPKAPASM